MVTIKQLDNGRDNNFDLLRFIAATMVVFSHSYLVTGKVKLEPLQLFWGFITFGTLGVWIFFTISGFLITKSLYRQPTLNSFVWARVLRIFPGLLVTALFCGLVIGPICTEFPLKRYFADGMLYDFMWRLFTVHNFNNILPGTFNTVPYVKQINSPIWTLAGELVFYGIVLAWGAILLIWKKQFGTLLKALPVLIIVAVYFIGINYLPWYVNNIISWGILFLIGALCYFLREWVIINIPLLIGFLVNTVILFHYRSGLFVPAFNVLLVYGVFVFAYHPKLQWRGFHKLGDCSYGIYIYAFPIQQLLVLKFPKLSVAGNFFASYIIVLILSWLSWHFIERPMLNLKTAKRVVA